MKLVVGSIAAVGLVLLSIVAVWLTSSPWQAPTIRSITSQNPLRKPATERAEPIQEGSDPKPLPKPKEPDQPPPAQEVVKQPLIPNAEEPKQPPAQNQPAQKGSKSK